MSELTQEQEATIARQFNIARSQAIRANSITKLRALFPKRTRGAEHTHLLATLVDTNAAMVRYEDKGEEEEIALHGTYVEVFKQTVERLETIIEQSELANKPAAPKPA